MKKAQLVGCVIDEEGNAVPHIHLYLLRQHIKNRHMTYVIEEDRYTDDTGRYVFEVPTEEVTNYKIIVVEEEGEEEA